MKTRIHMLISFFCLLLGMLVYGFYQEWIIIRLPWHTSNISPYITPTTTKRMVLLWWYAGQWKYESQQILWNSTSTTDTVYYILQAWLALMKEEHKINPKTTLQSVAITNADHAYISFDQNPLPQEISLYEKWMLIESLLKTLRENKLNVQAINLLVNHRIIQDRHLDFSSPWPIQGFLLKDCNNQ